MIARQKKRRQSPQSLLPSRQRGQRRKRLESRAAGLVNPGSERGRGEAYEQMSKLLDDLIKQNRADAAAYEEFLRKAEELVVRLAQKQPEAGIPAALHGKSEAIKLYNNLGSIPATTFQCPVSDEDRATLALKIDRIVREHAPAGWKGDETRERQVLNTLFPVLDRDRETTQSLFEIIKNQPGY